MCLICKEVVGVGELNNDKICQKCSSPEAKKRRREMALREEEIIAQKNKLEELNRQELEYRLSNFFITTETAIDIPIEKRIEVIFSEHVYGLNVIKDFFSGIRDIVGGRVASIEQPIRDTNKKIIEEMKMKAIELGGDAIVGLKIDYQTGGGFIALIATGTVVKLKDS